MAVINRNCFFFYENTENRFNFAIFSSKYVIIASDVLKTLSITFSGFELLTSVKMLGSEDRDSVCFSETLSGYALTECYATASKTSRLWTRHVRTCAVFEQPGWPWLACLILVGGGGTCLWFRSVPLFSDCFWVAFWMANSVQASDRVACRWGGSRPSWGHRWMSDWSSVLKSSFVPLKQTSDTVVLGCWEKQIRLREIKDSCNLLSIYLSFFCSVFISCLHSYTFHFFLASFFVSLLPSSPFPFVPYFAASRRFSLGRWRNFLPSLPQQLVQREVLPVGPGCIETRGNVTQCLWSVFVCRPRCSVVCCDHARCQCRECRLLVSQLLLTELRSLCLCQDMLDGTDLLFV